MMSQPEFSTDRFALKLGLFYAAYFLVGGIQLPFFPLWLEAKGFDARGIGLAIALPMLVRVVAVPLVAHQADRYRALKTTMVIATLGGTLAMTAVGLLQSHAAMLAAFALAAAFYSPVMSITDAYALTGLAARRHAYGPVRVWGSVSFIAGNVGAGLLLAMIAPTHLIWLIVASFAAAFACSLLLVPLDRAPAAPDTTRGSILSLAKNPAFLLVAAASSLIQGSHALYYGFSTIDWRAAGLSGVSIGVLWGIGVAAEIVLFALAARLPSWLSPLLLMAIGGAGGLIRWTAMALDPPGVALPLLQCLHAASFGATHLGAMAFLARAVPRDVAATAQGTVSTISGVVMAGATGLSGLIYAASGSLAYLMMAAMTLAGLTCALIAHRLWPNGS